jgi:hypothetical protein
VSDIDTAAEDSLKALDPEWPIREADIVGGLQKCSELVAAVDLLTPRRRFEKFKCPTI